MSSLDVDRSISRSPLSSKGGSTSLTFTHIDEALARSEDGGRTLVFMKKNLTSIGSEATEELASIGRTLPDDESMVERMALGNNRLTSLPIEFALLSRLRYLNLKSNSIAVFPHVLTMMPSLDTLDIGHNKIQRLPSDPGHLVNLRVFCFSRNKLTRLPTYLTQFTRLTVLEVERNPLEWPPNSIMDRPSKFPTAEAMKDWIQSVQMWMETDTLRPSHSFDDSGFTDQHEFDSKLEDSFNSWSRFPHSGRETDEGVTPHARSFSVDSNLSVSSIAESDIVTPPSSFEPSNSVPLHLGILQSYSAENSPTRSFESYLPSPAESETFFDDPSASAHKNGDILQHPVEPQHARNASYAPGTFQSSGRRSELAGKKSMPDLRTAKLNFSKKTAPELPDRGMSASTPSRNRIHDDFSIPSPLSQRQDSGSSSSVGSTSRITRPSAKESVHFMPPLSPSRAASSMAFERNSYFRRLSTLPAATISNTLPKPLVFLIDSARSILFAACQIYQTLEHYTIQAIDDRLSSVLRKVLDPASTDMTQLINSLDRFDATSRKTIPPPSICRGVVESCRDTVVVFGKAVGVLSLQLKVIATGDDVRYLRNMLLTLYGAAAEITSAWQNMLPQIDAIKHLLHNKQYRTASPTSTSDPSDTSIPFQLEQPPPLGLRSNGRSRTARRHAGSFSSKDVELGKQLPSYDEPPVPRSRMATRTPTRKITPVTISSPIPPSPQPLSSTSSNGTFIPPSASPVTHSRSASIASLQGSSTASSPSIPHKPAFLDLPSTSKTQVDKVALDAVQEAVSVAPSVWSLMEDVLSDILDAKPNVRENLEKAKAVTLRLSDTIKAMKDFDVLADRKNLREDAHVFLKTVIQLSNVVKSYGGTQSSQLRIHMVKLTKFTEEFAILLHVSSYSPSPNSRPYSPMLSASASHTNLLGLPDESRVSSGLSRSRSAQPTVTISKIAIAPPEGSRSALHTQSFKVPIVRHFKVRETHIDSNDPG